MKDTHRRELSELLKKVMGIACLAFSMYKAVSSIPSTTKKERGKERKEIRRLSVMGGKKRKGVVMNVGDIRRAGHKGSGQPQG